MKIKNELEISEKSPILTELASPSDDLFLELPGLNKREGHSTFFQSLETRFDELFDNAADGKDIERINSLLHDAIIELLNHRITIAQQLTPDFLELQRTLQECMPLNNYLTIQGYAEKNQEFLNKDPLYLKGCKEAEKNNDVVSKDITEPPRKGSILYTVTAAKYIPAGFFQKTLAEHLHSKNKILTSLIKIKNPLDVNWLHNTVMNLFKKLEKFRISNEYQINPSNVEKLNVYFSLLNTIRSNFYYTDFIFRMFAAESHLFLTEYKINHFERITERLAVFFGYIRKFFDLTYELAFFIKEFVLFYGVIESNEEFMKKLLDFERILKDLKEDKKGENHNEPELNCSELARTLGHRTNTKFVTLMRHAGFKMPDGKATLNEAKKWIKDHNFRLTQDGYMVDEKKVIYNGKQEKKKRKSTR